MPTITAPVNDLATATPVEIDTRLAEISEAHFIAADRYQRYTELAAKASMSYQRDSYTESAAEYRATAVALEPEIDALTAEFSNRGGWTRAFLVVTNGQGHVHRNRACSSCYITTQYAWVTELSGHDEDEIVAAAGERACTYCYPTAPVEVLNRPTSIFSKDEQRIAAERAERAAKKEAANAATITDVLTGEVLYKTERAALNAASAALDDTLWYGGHPSDQKWADTVSQAVAAVAAKRGTSGKELLAELQAKAEKKFAAKVRKIVKDNKPGAWNYSTPDKWMDSIRIEAERQGLI